MWKKLGSSVSDAGSTASKPQAAKNLPKKQSETSGIQSSPVTAALVPEALGIELLDNGKTHYVIINI